MNKTDVIAKVSEKSGVAADVCEKLLKAFEEQAEAALADRFKGIKNNRADMMRGISERSGVVLEVCERVMTALEESLDSGLSDKLMFLK